MKTRIVAAALTLFLLAASSGCGGDGEDGSPGGQATRPGDSSTTGAGGQGSARGESGSGGRTVDPYSELPDTDVEGKAQLERYLRERYGGRDGRRAAWYGELRDLEVDGGVALLETRLRGDSAGRRMAREICVAVTRAYFERVDSARVFDRRGRILTRC